MRQRKQAEKPLKSDSKNNVLIVQSGGCTAVMNRSLAGAVSEVLAPRRFGQVYGAVHGFEGVLQERFLDLRRQPEGIWRAIGNTPGAALGSSRRRLHSEELPQVLETLSRHGIRYLFVIGGNDSADTAHRLASEAKTRGVELTVVLIPKTIDNDLAATDHSPGYGSAARFVALATMGVGRDAEGMGPESPIAVLEVMGRNAGWLAAAGALAKRAERDAPHVICLPEVPIDEERLLGQVEEAYRRWGFAVVVVAENARGPHGPLGGEEGPFYVDSFGHRYFEGPGRYLAQRIGQRLRVRARFEKPGTIQRSLMTCVSRVDADEAFLVGRAAVRYALEGHSDCMVTLVREAGERYRCSTGLAPLERVVGKERCLPPEYIDVDGSFVTSQFIDYARPLIGAPLPRFARLH